VYDRDAHEILIPDRTARWIEVGPAWAGNVGLDPGMAVAAGDAIIIVVIGKTQISGHEPRGYSKRAQCRDQEHCEVAATPAPELQGLDWILDALLVARHVSESRLDGLRHVDEKLASAS
jgi:hypothetical protein